MAIRKQHSDQLDLFAWADTRSQVKTCDSGIAISYEAKTASGGQVIDARRQFQQRTSDFITSLIFGYSCHYTFEANIISIAEYRHAVATEAFVLVEGIAHG